MTPGIYTLSRRIENPRPDRRVRDRWLSALVWKAGTRFAVRRAVWFENELAQMAHGADAVALKTIATYELTSLDDRYSERVLIIVHDGGAVTHARGGDDQQEAALLDLVTALVPSTAPDDALQWVFVDRGDGTSLHGCAPALFRLVRRGVVTIDQVREVLAEYDAELDAEARAETEAEKAAKGDPT